MPNTAIKSVLCVQSYAGSIACALGGFAAAAGFLNHFRTSGYLARDLGVWEMLWKTGMLALCGSAVEALPIPEYDNLTVAASTALIARWLFGF